MTEGELPRAIATGGAERGPVADDVLVLVSPRRAGIAFGVAIGVLAVAAAFAITVPTSLLGWIGGPRTDLGRYGGLRMRWEAPPGADVRPLDSYEHEGRVYVIDVPHVKPADVAATAARIGGSGRLEFREVLEVPEMKELARVLELPMKDQWPVDLDVDQWTPEEGGGRHIDYYLRGTPRAALEARLAEARERGWKLPPGAEIAFEHVQGNSWNSRPGHADFWRTYVVSSEVAMDRDDISHATGSYDPNTNRPIVLLEFTRAGGEKFGDLTARIKGQKLATMLDGEIRSAPIINSAIRGGRASIAMGGGDPQQTERDRDALLATLSSSELPGGGKILGAEYVAPSATAVPLALARLAIGVVAGGLAGLAAFALLRWLRPYRRRVPRLHGRARVDTRIAWTGIAIALFVVGSTIVLPGIDREGVQSILSYRGSFSRHGEPGLFSLEMFSLFAIGLTPAISSHVIVEIILSIVPRWRARRDRPESRGRIGMVVAILTLVIAAVQAWFIATYLESLDRMGGGVVGHPGLAFRGMVVVTLTAGALGMAWLASFITRRGIGNGYAVLISASWILHVPSQLERVDHTGAAVAVVAMLATMAVYLGVSRWRVRGARAVALGVPAAGLAPLSDAGGVMTTIGFLAALGVFGGMPGRAAEYLAPLHYETIGFAVVVIATAVWAYAFTRPGRRAKELERADLAPANWEMWVRSVVLSAIVLVVLRAFTRGLVRLDLGFALDAATLVFVAATCADVWDEARDRRRGLVPVWPLHDPMLADVVRDRLGGAGIEHHLQASRLRSLLYIFGSYVPVNVLVPAERADEAQRLVRGLFE